MLLDLRAYACSFARAGALDFGMTLSSVGSVALLAVVGMDAWPLELCVFHRQILGVGAACSSSRQLHVVLLVRQVVVLGPRCRTPLWIFVWCVEASDESGRADATSPGRPRSRGEARNAARKRTSSELKYFIAKVREAHGEAAESDHVPTSPRHGQSSARDGHRDAHDADRHDDGVVRSDDGAADPPRAAARRRSAAAARSRTGDTRAAERESALEIFSRSSAHLPPSCPRQQRIVRQKFIVVGHGVRAAPLMSAAKKP